MLLPLLACAAPPAPDVVLVSLDTTRADVIDSETTPNLWALAQRGARFTAAFTHAPTTLSSHSSVWTGEDPHTHAVARNGYALRSDAPTLPARMAEAGFDTMGVIGASALARPMGMDAGFRTWDETLGMKHQKRHEARAADVTDRALAALGERARGKAVFLFAHYYDAHAPYDAPAPYATKWVDPGYHGPFDGSRNAMQALGVAAATGTLDPADAGALRARYRGEVSYVDAEVGRLLAGLHDPIVVVFGDHGEALGDVGERPLGHGPDVDAVATHVPLIVAGPGVPATTIDTPVALSDVGATVLALAGVSGGLGRGRDLTQLWKAGAFAERSIPMEATQPKATERDGRWNNLWNERGILRGDWMLIATPWERRVPELVRWRSGSAAPDPGLEAALKAELQAWDAKAPPYRPDVADAATKEGLHALGYTE